MSLETKYFVLKPKAKTHEDPFARASQQAMISYANLITHDDRELANQLRDWAAKERNAQMALPPEI